MLSEKSFDITVAAVTAFAIILTVVFMNGEALGITPVDRFAEPEEEGYIDPDYTERLFDSSYVHTINIELPNWETWIETATDEQYTAAKITVDGEVYPNVGFRVKGNGSLLAVTMMASQRFSFKLEFDRYNTQTYHGLDKLCLNNLVEDATYMKDLVAYEMMRSLGVPTPLTSYVFVTVNGEDFGLYQAVEGVEDAFIRRNYGAAKGQLYKPDNVSVTEFGVGKNFNLFKFLGFILDYVDLSAIDMSQFENMDLDDYTGDSGTTQETLQSSYGDGASSASSDSDSSGLDLSALGDSLLAQSDDVLLKYVDDEPESYPNIFDNAKFKPAYKDEMRLITALKKLSDGEDLETTLDTDEVIRYFAAHNLVVNSDSYTGMSVHNYYLREYNGQLSILPWDYNLAYGTMLMSAHYAVNDPIDEPMAVRSDGNRPMFEWITADEGYKARYYGYLSELTESFDYLTLIESTRELIAPFVARDPTKFVTAQEFYEGAEELIRYLDLRFASVRNQLAGNIPATKAGQLEEPEKRIDASELDLNKLGDVTMGFADERQDLSSLGDYEGSSGG